DDTSRHGETAKTKKRRQRKAAPPLPNGDLLPIFIFDKSAQIASRPSFAKFKACQMVWDTVPVKAEHTGIKFPTPFESAVSGIVADFHNPAPVVPFVTYDAALGGFRVFSEGPRLISYVAVGR